MMPYDHESRICMQVWVYLEQGIGYIRHQMRAASEAAETKCATVESQAALQRGIHDILLHFNEKESPEFHEMWQNHVFGNNPLFPERNSQREQEAYEDAKRVRL